MYHKELLLKKIKTEKPVDSRSGTQTPKARPLETVSRQKALVEDELKRVSSRTGGKIDTPVNRKLIGEKKSTGKKKKKGGGHQQRGAR